jgi:SAM-dependent methyltransferase
VIGVDSNFAVAAHAAGTGIYRAVAVARADALPIATSSFASAFANCSIEHMDSLDSVLTEVARALRQDGIFLLSVLTDRFMSWSPLAKLLSICRAGEAGLLIQDQHVAYHHHVNAMSVPEWRDRLRLAGFRVVEEMPIVTGAAGQAFLLLDQLWHVQGERGIRTDVEWMQQTPRSMSDAGNLGGCDHVRRI